MRINAPERRKSLLRWVCLLVVLSVGCGQPPAVPAPPTAEAAPRAAALANAHPAARTVFEFLNSVRAGDQVAASTKLSPLSLKRIRELDLQISPPGSETAKFRVGGVDETTPDRASVECVWTDTDVQGQVTDERYRWMLRNVAGEWKITGVSVAGADGEQTVVLDFENTVGLVADAPGATKEDPASGGAPRQARQGPPASQPAGPR